MPDDPELLDFILSAIDRLSRADLCRAFAGAVLALNAHGGAIALAEAIDAVESQNPAAANELGDAVFTQARQGGVA